MKKLFAALLAISVTAALTGCNKPEEEQLIGKISEDTSVSSAAVNETENASEAETTVITESESVSETETTVTSESETVSEAKTTVTNESETVSDTKSGAEDTSKHVKTFSADAKSLTGVWYAVDFVSMENAVFTFSEDGSCSLVRDGYTESGTYTVSDGLVEVIYNDGKDWEAWAALFDGDVLIIKFIGWNYDLIREEYKPYESGLTVGDYLYEAGNDGIEYVLSKERSALAEQEDLLGVWKASDGSSEELIFFDSHGFVGMEYDDLSFIPVEVRNGVYTVTGEMPENVSLSEDDRRFYRCGEKVYVIIWEENYFGDSFFEYDGQTIIMERYEQDVLTADMFDGRAGIESETYYYFKDGKFYSFTNDIEDAGDIKEYDYKIDGNKIILPVNGKETEFAYYISGDYLYLIGENKYIAFSAQQ